MTSTDLHTAAAALGHQGGLSTSEAKQQAARENGKRGGRPRNEPKYHAGDRVTIIEPSDPDYGGAWVVTGLSPSTRKRRSGGQWRYRLSNGGYYNENMLQSN